MYSEGASKIKETNYIETNGNGFHKTREVYEKWKDWHPSVISHHGAMCCEIAREWIAATDFSELGGESVLTGPRWLRQRFNWGCSTFPIYWCEAVRRKTLDCGALAALAQEVFTVRGVKTYRIQLVQKFSEVATNQWSINWNAENAAPCWIENDLIYHEGCAIALKNDEIKVWDSSAGWWLNPKTGDGYGSTLAVRLSGLSNGSNPNFNWEGHIIQSNNWQKIKHS